MRPSCVAKRSADPPSSLLHADRAAWSASPDISWGQPPFLTWFRVVWTDDALFVRFDVADEQPWHTKTRRDDRLWEEEVVEVFLDPLGRGRDYAELEISPANVVCDLIVRQPWPTLRSDPSWDLAGLETAVRPWRDARSGSDGWTAVARLPWHGFGETAAGARVPPVPGDRWRFNAYRIKRPAGPSRPDEDVRLLAWAPTDSPSFHVPERFGVLIFE